MNDIEKLGQDVAGVTDKATLKAANVVADRVKVNLKRSRKKSYPPEYVHMQDDVKVGSLIDEDGDKVREVGGGRKTGYKWRFLEDGTSYMTGTQFASRTKLETEKEVEDIILEEVRKVLPE
jgi:HK97 gp10 family phage protein